MSHGLKAQKFWCSAHIQERENGPKKKGEGKGSNLQYQKHKNIKERVKGATYNIKNTIWIQIKMTNQ